MDNDFLDGIDEQFQSLMKRQGNGQADVRSGAGSTDKLAGRILLELEGLSTSQKEEVLAYVKTLKQKVE